MASNNKPKAICLWKYCICSKFKFEVLFSYVFNDKQAKCTAVFRKWQKTRRLSQIQIPLNLALK